MDEINTPRLYHPDSDLRESTRALVGNYFKQMGELELKVLIDHINQVTTDLLNIPDASNLPPAEYQNLYAFFEDYQFFIRILRETYDSFQGQE